MRRRYMILALGLLTVVDGLHLGAFVLLGPDIGATFGLGPAAIGALAAGALTMTAIAALPLASFAARRGRRAATALASGAGWSAAAAVGAVAPGAAALAATLAVSGATTASVGALHPALIVDAHPPEERVRALGAYRSIAALGALAAPVVVLAGYAVGLTWRGTFLLAAGTALVAVLAAAGLREPGTAPAPPSLSAADAARRLLAIPALRRLLVAHAAAGAFAIPLGAYFAFFLEDRWGLHAGQRAAVAGAGAVAVIVTLWLYAPEGERLLGRGPTALIALGWRLFALVAVLIGAAALVPSFAVMVTLIVAAMALSAFVEIAQVATLLTLAPAALRAHAAALAAVAVTGVGGIGGAVLLAGLEEPLGLGGAIAALAAPGLLAAAVLRSAGPSADRDAADVRADERLAAEPARPDAILELRGVVFGYGPTPVLDGVDLAVSPGELVALTGANGAGKTTLLRVVAGLEHPRHGVVRIAGRDRTWATAERRAADGALTVLGGRAIFATLTAEETVAVAAAVAGLAAGESATTLARLAALARFEHLVQRRTVQAAALSGGEQTLLGLAQALVRPPRLLLVDELTLGLAAETAALVTDTVRGLAAGGTAVVFVEQDERVALGLAARAVHLEGGRVAYDGPPAGLLERGDLRVPVLLG